MQQNDIEWRDPETFTYIIQKSRYDIKACFGGNSDQDLLTGRESDGGLMLLQRTMRRPRKSYSSLPTAHSYKVCYVLSGSTASNLHMDHHPVLFAFTHEVYEQIIHTWHCLNFTKYVHLNHPMVFYILRYEPNVVLMNVLSKTIMTL
jgi:hypothetical protein